MKSEDKIYQRAETSEEVSIRLHEILAVRRPARDTLARIRKLCVELEAEANALHWVRR